MITTLVLALLGWKISDLLTASIGPALNVFIATSDNLDPTTLPVHVSYGDPTGVQTTLSPGFAMYFGI